MTEFLKAPHCIGIKSFILISVHNFHQIFHLKTYKSTFYIYMISTGRENHFGLEFQCIALENFPIWFVSSNLAICWKVWLKSAKIIELKSTQMLYCGWQKTPKQLFGRQAHRNIQNTHIFTSSFSFIHGYVERNIVIRKRINAYRALASPSLIALSSKVVEIFQSNVVGDVDIYIGGGVFKSSLVGLASKVIS